MKVSKILLPSLLALIGVACSGGSDSSSSGRTSEPGTRTIQALLSSVTPTQNPGFFALERQSEGAFSRVSVSQGEFAGTDGPGEYGFADNPGAFAAPPDITGLCEAVCGFVSECSTIDDVPADCVSSCNEGFSQALDELSAVPCVSPLVETITCFFNALDCSQIESLVGSDSSATAQGLSKRQAGAAGTAQSSSSDTSAIQDIVTNIQGQCGAPINALTACVDSNFDAFIESIENLDSSDSTSGNAGAAGASGASAAAGTSAAGPLSTNTNNTCRTQSRARKVRLFFRATPPRRAPQRSRRFFRPLPAAQSSRE